MDKLKRRLDPKDVRRLTIERKLGHHKSGSEGERVNSPLAKYPFQCNV